MEAVDTIEFDHGIVAKIFPDEDPGSPREWDNLGVMYCTHPQYDLGDEQFTECDHASIEAVYEFLRDERDATCVLPLFLLDHSGITIRAGEPIERLSRNAVHPAGRFVMDHRGWDTSWVGFIYTTAERVRESGLTDESRVGEVLHGEVETYGVYLEGGVLGYVVEDGDGEHLDSCWGFYELSDVRATATSVAEHHVAERDRITRHNELALACWRD